MEIKELRVGNFVTATEMKYSGLKTYILEIKKAGELIHASGYKPIPITEEWLVKAGFEPLKHFTITNPFSKSIGRNRQISVSMAGTPNEMIFLTEVDDENSPTKVTCVIVLRNYDYDGFTPVHVLQNIFHSLSGTELTFNL